MDKVFEALERLTYFSDYNRSDDDHDLVLNALTELKQIKEAKHSDALKYLDDIGECYEEAGNEEGDCILYAKNYIGFNTIKYILLKAEAQEKLFKHIRRNDMENIIPLSSIIGGLSQDDKHRFIEHIYYTWTELAEKHEKLNEEHKRQTQELVKYKKALEIIKEKCVNIWFLMSSHTVIDYNVRIRELDDSEKFVLTQEEFELIKEMLK